MLALSRKKGQGIMIGENIELVILDITKEGVKVGIKAPKEVAIYRKEIYIQIQEENLEAINQAKENTKKLKQFLSNKTIT